MVKKIITVILEQLLSYLRKAPPSHLLTPIGYNRTISLPQTQNPWAATCRNCFAEWKRIPGPPHIRDTTAVYESCSHCLDITTIPHKRVQERGAEIYIEDLQSELRQV